MNLLFTGASGFLGNNILPLLKKQYDVSTVGLTAEDDYTVNLSKEIPCLSRLYDIVLHAAGKAHIVPKTEQEKRLFMDINFQGTVHLCRALEKSELPKSFIFISTVAVYGCSSGDLITEEHPLNGNDPYALSKRMAEEYLQEWCDKRGILLSILRPSLLAGCQPVGNLKDMIAGIKTGHYLSIGGGEARKSILMAQDIARLIPLIAEQQGIYNVCDSHHPSFRELETVITSQLGLPLPANIPYWLARSCALAGDCLGRRAPINSLRLRKITETLTFSNEKARKQLGWEPLDVLSHFKLQ